MTIFTNLIDVFNEAMLSVGEAPINENDNSAFAAVFRGVGESISKRMMTTHNWAFSRRELTLVKSQVNNGQDGFDDFVYNLPVDFLKIRRVRIGRCNLREYKIIGSTLVTHVDSDEIIMDHTYWAPVDLWSAEFRDGMRMYFEGLIRKSVLQDYSEGNADMQAARVFMVEAYAREFNVTGNRHRNDGGRVAAARQGFGRHG